MAFQRLPYAQIVSFATSAFFYRDYFCLQFDHADSELHVDTLINGVFIPILLKVKGLNVRFAGCVQ